MCSGRFRGRLVGDRQAAWRVEEGLLARGGQVAGGGNGAAQHERHIADLSFRRDRLHAAREHDIAERAARRNLLRARRHGLLRAELVDALAQLFLHEHARATGTAAESLVAVVVHLRKRCTGRLDELTRRVEDLVVAAQEARVVVGHRLAVLRGARHWDQQLLPHQTVEQLRVVQHVEVAVEVGVFVANRIEAVRARGDDFALAFGDAGKGVVKRGDVLLRHHLEQELISGTARRVAGTGLARGQHAELHAGGVQHVHHGARRGAALVVISTRATDPEQVLQVRKIFRILADDRHLDAIGARLIDPRAPLRGVAPPRVALRFHVLKQPRQLRREVGFRQHLKPAQVRHVVDVLDIHRALVHARTAVGAGPQDVIINRARHRQHVEPLVRVVIIQRALAQVHHELLRAQRLLGVPCGAQVLAAAAFGAGGGVEKHLPAPRLEVLQVRRGYSPQRLLTVRVALEEDIEEGHETVPHHAPLEIARDARDEHQARQQLHQGKELHHAWRRLHNPRHTHGQEISPRGAAAIGGDGGGLDGEHAQALEEHDGFHQACGEDLRIIETAAALGVAELEAHADEETDAEHGADREDLFDEVVDRPVAEPRPAFIGREGLDIGLEPHDGAEEEAHHHEPVRGIDQRPALEVGMAEDFDKHAAEARQGAVGTV